MKENIKLSIFEFAAALCGILLVIFCLLPSYIESGGFTLTDFQLIFGNERTEISGLLIFGFILVAISIIVSIGGGILLLLNKVDSDLKTMIIGIVGAITILGGGIIITCAILITGLDKANSELGLIQGNWFIGIGNYLVLISALLGFGLSYPAALTLLHHKDQKDSPHKKNVVEEK